MSKRAKSIDPTIDDWIASHGLDAQIDDFIRTCGFERVLASVEAAPGRFAARGERNESIDRNRSQPGAPVKRTGLRREVLFSSVEYWKREGLTDKEACKRFAKLVSDLDRKLANKGALKQLGLLGFVGLSSDTIIREYKRIKPKIRSLADGAPALEREVKRRTGRAIKATISPRGGIH